MNNPIASYYVHRKGHGDAMLKFMKSIFKNIKYHWEFRGRGVKFDFSCCFAANGVECEGMNIFHRNVTFRGKIGYGSYIGNGCNLNANIGRYCSIASNVKTITGTHPTRKFVSTHPSFFSVREQAGFTYVSSNRFQEDITVDPEGHLAEIGDDVWIGNNVLILPGVHIGSGAIIAAGAVVTKDVAPYSIVGGVPARMIRLRFDEKQIKELLEIKWWNKPKEWIEHHSDLFTDINDFLSEVNSEKEDT